jgi:hypothetical protein
VAAVVALANHSHPEHTAVGVVLTASSVPVLPIIARAKLRLSNQLASSALHGDGVLTLAGAALAAATLVSLLVESAPAELARERSPLLVLVGKPQASHLAPGASGTEGWY